MKENEIEATRIVKVGHFTRGGVKERRRQIRGGHYVKREGTWSNLYSKKKEEIKKKVIVEREEEDSKHQ